MRHLPARARVAWPGGCFRVRLGLSGLRRPRPSEARRLAGRRVLKEDKERGVADTLPEGSLMLKYYERSELLEKLQSSDYYGTFNWVHTLGVAQNQKQPYIPGT